MTLNNLTVEEAITILKILSRCGYVGTVSLQFNQPPEVLPVITWYPEYYTTTTIWSDNTACSGE
jgi:hypothetical protein